MVVWIKKLARLVAWGAFFGVFIAGIDFADPLDPAAALLALAKAGVAAFLFWLMGYILGDIIIKGLVDTLEADAVPLDEGGMMQRIRGEKERSSPEAAVENNAVNKDEIENSRREKASAPNK